jgi:hypothetical protein
MGEVKAETVAMDSVALHFTMGAEAKKGLRQVGATVPPQSSCGPAVSNPVRHELQLLNYWTFARFWALVC